MKRRIKESIQYKEINNPIFTEVIRYPIISNKSFISKKGENLLILSVEKWADKTLIKKSVEGYYEIKVTKVRTLNVPKKIRLTQKKKGLVGPFTKRKPYKKAYISYIGDLNIYNRYIMEKEKND